MRVPFLNESLPVILKFETHYSKEVDLRQEPSAAVETQLHEN